MLRFLELQGRIEAARAHDTEHVRTLFEEIGQQVRAAGHELQDFVALGTRAQPLRRRRSPARRAASRRGQSNRESGVTLIRRRVAIGAP